MDLAAARTELEERGFDSLSPTRQAMYLNHGKDALENVWPWPWLRTTTSGTSPLSIPDLKTVLWVQTSTGLELRGVDEQYIAGMGWSFTQTGPASYWWLQGESTLQTIPLDTSTSLSVTYLKFSPALSDDGDEPLFNERWDMNWIDLSVVEAYRDSDDHDAADRLLGAVRSRLEVMIDAYGDRNFQNPGLTVVRQSDDG